MYLLFRILLRRGDAFVCSSIYVFNKLLLNVNVHLLFYILPHTPKNFCVYDTNQPQWGRDIDPKATEKQVIVTKGQA